MRSERQTKSHAMRKFALGQSIGLFALVGSLALPGAAYAQQAAAESGEDEIVVTARKREERLQDVPLAVTALSMEALQAAGANSTQDLARLSPGLFYSAFTPSIPNLFVRGVGTRSYDAGAESSIGTFIDGVYIARFGSQIQELADVQRVEVLRGPQGALFGRNTIGGAINIVTQQPSDEFRANLGVTYGQAGNFDGDEAGVTALVSGPLVADELFGQVSYSRRETDGATQLDSSDDLVNGATNEAARARLVLRPAGDLEFDLSADAFRTFDASWVWRSNDVGGLRPNVLFAAAPGPAVNPDPYITNLTPGQGGMSRDGWGANGTIRDTIGAINVTSITAYRESQNGFRNDLDGTSLDSVVQPSTEEASQFSQELRFASDADTQLPFGLRGDWLFGLYYFQEDISRFDNTSLGPDSFAPGITIINGADVSTESWAVFGQVGIDLTENLRLDIGLRTSSDSKDAHLFDDETPFPVFSVPYEIDLSDSWSSTDPSVSLSYHVNPDLMIFASYSSGFKSGGFQFVATDPVSASQIVRPESVESYQAGVRADWFGNRLRTNLSVFHYDYTDIQVPRIEGIAVHITNAATSTIEGLELEGYARFTDSLRLEYGYAYLDAHYDDYQFDAGKDFSGNELPRSPRNTLNAALVFETPTAIGDVTARVAGNYVDSFFFEPDNGEFDPGTEEPSHTTFNASLGLRNGAYSITLWGHNLGDEEARATVLNFGNGSALFTGNRLLEVWAPRRTFGITLAGNW
jgi:iron complex outermembrane recepter protein